MGVFSNRPQVWFVVYGIGFTTVVQPLVQSPKTTGRTDTDRHEPWKNPSLSNHLVSRTIVTFSDRLYPPYHIISYHIISYHLPIFSGSPPIFLAFPQTNPPAQLRFSTSHLAPPQLILSEWLPRFAPRQPGRFPSQFSDITWMEPI